MAAPRKYPDELRERAVRMAVDLRRDPATRTGALRRVGEQLGVNPEQVTPNASFIEDLGADSLDIVELVMEFEKEFNIDIPDEDAEKLRTVGDALKYLNEKVGA